MQTSKNTKTEEKSVISVVRLNAGNLEKSTVRIFLLFMWSFVRFPYWNT